MTRICLASASPRRKELLERAGVALEIVPADIDESVAAGEEPVAYARRLAAHKARRVAERHQIMLEECGLPYVMNPVNISKGEQFKPDFLKISPNNRMPAIVDPQGPGGGRSRSSSPARSCNISGARPASSIRPTSARASRSTSGCSGRWAGSGRWPGRCITSRTTRAETLTYAINRYVNEVNRLYGVMNIRLNDRPFIAGKYSIADMALVGWVNGWERQGQDIDEFPNLKRWLETMKARPAVKRGMALGLELRQGIDMKDPKVQAVLFGQRARTG